MWLRAKTMVVHGDLHHLSPLADRIRNAKIKHQTDLHYCADLFIANVLNHTSIPCNVVKPSRKQRNWRKINVKSFQMAHKVRSIKFEFSSDS